MERKGLEPSYEQKSFDPAGRHNRLQLVASREAEFDSLKIHQDARIYLADIGIPAAVYQKLDLPYTSPFGERFRVPLEVR